MTCDFKEHKGYILFFRTPRPKSAKKLDSHFLAISSSIWFVLAPESQNPVKHVRAIPHAANFLDMIVVQSNRLDIRPRLGTAHRRCVHGSRTLACTVSPHGCITLWTTMCSICLSTFDRSRSSSEHRTMFLLTKDLLRCK